VLVRPDLLEKVIAFVRSIGIEVEEGATPNSTVPGVDIIGGHVCIDTAILRNVGDVLHEAGHIALMPSDKRSQLDGWIGSNPADEMSTIAWSWAAGVHLGLAPEDILHDGALGGKGDNLRENFVAGSFVGVPMLQYWRMTSDYPRMLRWTR